MRVLLALQVLGAVHAAMMVSDHLDPVPRNVSGEVKPATLVTICRSTVERYPLGEVMLYTDDCWLLDIRDTTYWYKLPESTLILDIYNTSSECNSKAVPLKSTKLTSACTSILPDRPMAQQIFATADLRTCFPKSCHTRDACLKHNASNCILESSCKWRVDIGTCMDACYEPDSAHCPNWCSTDGAHCVAQMRGKSWSSWASAGVGALVVFVAAIMVIVILGASIVFLCCQRSNRAHVDYVAAAPPPTTYGAAKAL